MSRFQASVLELVSKVPKGKVTTYKELARALGRPRAYRAVGNALVRNPRQLKIPCHRVVKSNGEIGGYRFGRERKMKLLVGEGIKIEREGNINLKEYLFKFDK